MNAIPFRERLGGAAWLAILLLMPYHAMAEIGAPAGDAPKPLLVEPGPTAEAPKPSADDMPQEFKDTYKANTKDYMEWAKADAALQKECANPQTPFDKTNCARKQKVSQGKLDVISKHIRDLFKSISQWRRKKRGLPPPDWWGDDKPQAPANGTTTTPGNPAVPAPPKESPVLLPKDNTPLPAGTF